MLVIHNYTRIESTCQEQQINWHHLFLNHGSRYINLPIFCAVAQYLCIYVLSVATVVNTEFTQSVYLYVYTTHTPPHGPCPSPCIHAHIRVCGACVGTLWASCVRHSAMCVACEPKLLQNWLFSADWQLLWYQLPLHPAHVRLAYGRVMQKLQCRCIYSDTKYPTPYRGGGCPT